MQYLFFCVVEMRQFDCACFTLSCLALKIDIFFLFFILKIVLGPIDCKGTNDSAKDQNGFVTKIN